jgi:hypothetical protein
MAGRLEGALQDSQRRTSPPTAHRDRPWLRGCHREGDDPAGAPGASTKATRRPDPRSGSQPAIPRDQHPQQATAPPGSSHGDGEPLTQQCPTTSAPPGLTRAPAAPWHGRCGGAWGRCSSPYPHGLLRPLLPDPPGARARLPRKQQSLVRAPHHGPHRPPRQASAEAAPHAPAHRPLGGPQAAGTPHRHGLGAVRQQCRSWWGPCGALILMRQVFR